MNDEIRKEIQVDLDKGEYLRSCCPNCGLEFKTNIDPSAISNFFNQACQDSGLDLGDSINSEEPSIMHCPYCGVSNDSGDFFTEETYNYLIQYANREIIYPTIEKFQNNLTEMFGSTRSSKGSMSINVDTEKNIKPVRPISGPEPPDMKIVFLLCCNEKIKIHEQWENGIFCVQCGTQLQLF